MAKSIKYKGYNIRKLKEGYMAYKGNTSIMIFPAPTLKDCKEVIDEPPPNWKGVLPACDKKKKK